MKSKRLQVALALGVLAAVASASVGVTLALYSSKPTGETNTFTSGTVSLTNVVTNACTSSTTAANAMAPGDTTGTTCTLATTYSGLSAYMAVDVYIATKSNAAGGGSPTNLYDTTANGAQITVSSTTPTVASYTPIPTTTLACGTGPDNVNYSTYSVCYQTLNYLVQVASFTSLSPTFTTTVALPVGQANSYQGGSAVVVLTVHAVQSAHNAITCGTVTAGLVCTPSGTFLWS